MKKSHSFLFLSSVFLWGTIATAQTYLVDLPRLLPLEKWDIHLTVLSSSPKEKLTLPKADTTGARFFEIFYSWKIEDDPHIAVMVVPSHGGEALHIDLNNNEDLRDDGYPSFFPYAQDTLSFEIAAPADPAQKVKIRLQRKPDLPDSLLQNYVDTAGNLNPRFARFAGGLKGDLSYQGNRGTFYFDVCVTVRNGNVITADGLYEIGLFDYSNNGLFNDDDDVLLVDLNRDGTLSYPDESFALNDVFVLGTDTLAISAVDKHGLRVEVTTTAGPPTSFFLETLERQAAPFEVSGNVNDDIWSITARTIDGDSMTLGGQRGTYLLLNFWGEWCRPCLDEIPALVEGHRSYGPKKLRILSFLKSSNLEKAKSVIRNKGMNWPQLLLSDEIEKEFKIKAYPTNILILPDGKSFVRVSQVSLTFLKSKLK